MGADEGGTMRRLLTPMLGLLLLLPVTGATAQEPFVLTDVSQWANADQIRLHGDSGVIVGAAGIRFLGDDGPVTLGAVFRGTCKVSRGKRSMSVSCSARGRAVEIPMEDLDFDPALREADLKVTVGGQKHHVHWTGRGDMAQFGAGVGFGGGVGVGAGGGGYRDCKFSGKVFGKPFKGASWMDWGFLIEEGWAEGYVNGAPHIQLHGDQLTVSRSFSIPRS
jgi:hypothetical protein